MACSIGGTLEPSFYESLGSVGEISEVVWQISNELLVGKEGVLIWNLQWL